MGDKKSISALVTGGEASAGPPLGPSLGPMGLNVLQVVNTINEKTKDFPGNISMDSVIKIAKMKLESSYSADIQGAVKEVIGSCVSIGMKVENKPAKEVFIEISSGKYEQFK
jgi:large subunit ribosomal protein L11